MSAQQAPLYYRALVVESIGADLRIEQRAVPDAVPGSVVVRVLASPVLSYQRDIYDGTRGKYFKRIRFFLLSVLSSGEFDFG